MPSNLMVPDKWLVLNAPDALVLSRAFKTEEHLISSTVIKVPRVSPAAEGRYCRPPRANSIGFSWIPQRDAGSTVMHGITSIGYPAVTLGPFTRAAESK
jgi:hypothetical protein